MSDNEIKVYRDVVRQLKPYELPQLVEKYKREIKRCDSLYLELDKLSGNAGGFNLMGFMYRYHYPDEFLRNPLNLKRSSLRDTIGSLKVIENRLNKHIGELK